MEKKILGIIAGNGKFPLMLARKAQQQGFHVVAACVKGDTSFLIRFVTNEHKFFSVGDLNQLFIYLKEKKARNVIMAGQVNPNNLFDPNLKLDPEFQQLFDAIKDRKTDTIFGAIADKLKSHGIELLDSTFLLKEYLAPKGTLTKRGPTLNELADIDFGIQIAKSMGGLDVGQTVVVKDKAIVAIEAMEGTDQAILRGGNISRQGAVVVKMSKPKQDVRFDVPVIGPRTIKHMIKSQSKCLAIEAGKTLIIDEKSCVKLANKSGICIVAA
jgi:DUF1009 family protein